MEPKGKFTLFPGSKLTKEKTPKGTMTAINTITVSSRPRATESYQVDLES